jgi:type VI secretion system protein VasD
MRWPLMARLAASACAAVLMGLAACSHTPRPPPKTPPVTITIEPTSDINPDNHNQPCPVVVRVYQLSSTTEFLGAQFEAIYPNDTATLGKSLISKQEMTAIPGHHDRLQLELASETRALGVLVAFSDFEHARWRLTTAPGPHALRLVLSADAAQLISTP